MATFTVEVDLLVAGLTVTADIYPELSDTALATGLTLTPQTNRTTVYRCSTTATVTPGLHTLFVKEGGVVIGSFPIGHMTNSDATYFAKDANASVVSAGAAAVATVQAGLAESAELAKVPKSDGTVSHNATALAAIANATEAAILNEGDATALLAAIGAKVEEFLINDGDATATLAAIAAAVRTNLTTELGRIDAAISSRSSHTAANVRSEMDSNSTKLADILTDTAEIGAAGVGLNDIPWNASWDAEVQSEVVDALQETVPDSVPADGSRPNLQQAAYMVVQMLTEFAISGTTLTVKKPDGSTALMTFTLNDATDPTSLTRAS